MLSVSWLATMSHSPDGSNWKWRGVAPRVCWYDGLCGAAEQIKSHDSPLLIHLSVNVEFSPFLLEPVKITVQWRSDISSFDIGHERYWLLIASMIQFDKTVDRTECVNSSVARFARKFLSQLSRPICHTYCSCCSAREEENCKWNLYNIYIQGSTNRRSQGCVNAAGKLRQKW